MSERTATPHLSALLADAGSAAPEWVELLPAGPNVLARDGRRWHFDPDKVLAAFASNNGPLSIDYEHGQDHLAPKGQAAPAAGWITALENRGGAIWGKVEWTARAAEMITAKEYRFVSPSIRYLEGGEITRLAGAGLVNRPALEMTALSREDDNPKKEPAMSLKAIAKALGLEDSADEKAVLAAIATRNDERSAICQALELDATASTDDITAKLTAKTDELKTALAAVQEAGEQADTATLRAELDTAKTELAALKEKDLNRDIDLALDAATAEGKITPASREEFRAMCAEKGGLDRFKALVEKLPVIAAPSNLKDREASTTGTMDDESPVALAARATKYRAEQAEIGREISTATAIAELREKAQ